MGWDRGWVMAFPQWLTGFSSFCTFWRHALLIYVHIEKVEFLLCSIQHSEKITDPSIHRSYWHHRSHKLLTKLLQKKGNFQMESISTHWMCTIFVSSVAPITWQQSWINSNETFGMYTTYIYLPNPSFHAHKIHAGLVLGVNLRLGSNIHVVSFPDPPNWGSGDETN